MAAEFDSVVIGTESERYSLQISGFRSGEAGAGGLETYHSGIGFSTFDNDETAGDRNCVHTDFGAAYWYRATGTIPTYVDSTGQVEDLNSCYSVSLTSHAFIFWREEDADGTMLSLEYVDRVAMRIQTDPANTIGITHFQYIAIREDLVSSFNFVFNKTFYDSI